MILHPISRARLVTAIVLIAAVGALAIIVFGERTGLGSSTAPRAVADGQCAGANPPPIC